MFQSQRKWVSMKYESKNQTQCFCWFCVLDAVHANNITILVDNTWCVDNTVTGFHQQGNNIPLQFKLVLSCRWSFKYNASILVNNKSCWIFHTNCPSLIGLWGKNYIVLQFKKASTWNIVQNSELLYTEPERAGSRRHAPSTGPTQSTVTPAVSPVQPDEPPPATLVICDSIVRHIRSKTSTTCCFPAAKVQDIIQQIPALVSKHPHAENIVVHVFILSVFFNLLKDCNKSVFISGPIPTFCSLLTLGYSQSAPLTTQF